MKQHQLTAYKIIYPRESINHPLANPWTLISDHHLHQQHHPHQPGITLGWGCAIRHEKTFIYGLIVDRLAIHSLRHQRTNAQLQSHLFSDLSCLFPFPRTTTVINHPPSDGPPPLASSSSSSCCRARPEFYCSLWYRLGPSHCQMGGWMANTI